jgi:hypothetical protein
MGDGAGQVRVGVPIVTVPVKVTICGLAGPVSDIDNCAVTAPTWSGVKLTVIEQLDPDASVAPQLLV